MSLRREIQKLQKRVGVMADGIVGPVTVAACHAELDRLTMDLHEEKTCPAKRASIFQFDKRTEKNLGSLRTEVQPKFRRFMAEAQAMAAAQGVDYLTISGLRTYAEQDALYAMGRTNPGKKVTNARGGYSNHNFGDAIDNGVFRGIRYLDGSDKKADRDLAANIHRQAAVIAKRHGLVWGGDWKSFKDYPHFEDATSLTMPQKRAKVKSGEWKV